MSDNKFIDILKSHPVQSLKAEIRKHNIRGYSKMTKNEIINLMIMHKPRFKYLKKYKRS